SRQRNRCKTCGQRVLGQRLSLGGLRQQEFMPQVLWRIAAIEKRRLENGGSRKGTLNPGGIDLAAGLLLQIRISADVVGVGVGVVDGSQAPAMSVENLAHLAPGILIVAAV